MRTAVSLWTGVDTYTQNIRDGAGSIETSLFLRCTIFQWRTVQVSAIPTDLNFTIDHMK